MEGGQARRGEHVLLQYNRHEIRLATSIFLLMRERVFGFPARSVPRASAARPSSRRPSSLRPSLARISLARLSFPLLLAPQPSRPSWARAPSPRLFSPPFSCRRFSWPPSLRTIARYASRLTPSGRTGLEKSA